MEGYFLDTNLLVLFVVGSEGRDLISKHCRLRDYSAEDYDILCGVLENAGKLYATPNTLTETSNLLSQHAEPERSLLMGRLQYLIYDSQEITVASTKASSNRNFRRLGLTDAVLLEAATEEIPLLTVDLSLYLAAIALGEERAIKFTPLRNLQAHAGFTSDMRISE